MVDQQIPQPNSGIMDIAAYVPGKSKVSSSVKVHKLSSNETPLGPSAHVQDAMKAALDKLELYPDGSSLVLREAIASTHGLNAENIMCGNGSDELLGLLSRTYLSAGDEAIYSEHGFLVYKIEILASGATPVVVKEQDYTVDVDAVLAAVTPKTKMVFLANPNNPTGTYLPSSELRRLHAGLPKNVILVLDGAYAEYVRKNDYEAGIEMVSANENVVMTRTFSKIYGLASLRIGWIYAPLKIIDALDRVRGPFNVNALAIAAGAAAMNDQSHVEAAIDHNLIWVERVTNALQAIGLDVVPSVGNFVLINFPEDGARTAQKANEFLMSKGFIVRAVGGYGLPNSLRMTIGSQEANEGVIAALTEFMGA